ncbi:hypothetical protein LUZ60_004342 [Juncus effusus]|nr:hypothetical protein LUZ60_004342 [Juncus effusus]
MELAPSGDAPPSAELYAVPSSSGWFQWDEIHETEKRALPEFFEGVSITKNPRVYKDYRDFIINKYRENPSKKLRFTEIRKALIGDVTLLHKLFSFLEKHGLINFSVEKQVLDSQVEPVRTKVLIEEGPPHGLYVVPAPAVQAVPTSLTKSTENGIKFAPLSSYSDVFGEWDPRKKPLCVFCGEQCVSDPQHKLEDGMKICSKCYESKNDKDLESTEAPVTIQNETSNTNITNNNHISTNNNDKNNLRSIPSLAWTDQETLTLLEGVLKHGDDWDLITQHVRTRNKTECVARLIQLPFGERILSNTIINGISKDDKGGGKVSEPVEIELDKKDEMERTGEGSEMEEEPVKKKSRVEFDLSAKDSLMRQVGLLAIIGGPGVASAAAEAAIAELCNESEHARDVFDFNNFEGENEKFVSSNQDSSLSNIDANMEVETGQETIKQEATGINKEEDFKSMVYKIRAGVATAIGASAARAKLLADHEEREIELLMSSIIQSQLKKIQLKLKHFEELELIMEKERALMQEQKGTIIKEWLIILQQIFQAGVPRWKDNFVPKPH